MSVGLIKRRNQKKFWELMAKIRNQYSFNINMYPKILSSAYELMAITVGLNLIEKIAGVERYTEDTAGEDEDTGEGREGTQSQGYSMYGMVI